MSQQPESMPNQNFNVDNASIREAQVGQAGRDLHQVQYVTVYDSFNLAGIFRKQDKPLAQQQYRLRKVLFSKVKQYWVEGVLEKSLHTTALSELGLEEQLDAIERPFSSVQEIPDEFRQTLPEGTSITEVFNQMGEGRTLLILGEPGAGKTTILLKLTGDLIARTEEDLSQTIPVVFNLSSWVSQRQTIADWLVQELNSKYQVSKSLGKAWVEEQQLLLLLDGLDEVKAERREACVEALNQFIQAHGQTEMVVTSRIRDYQALSARLTLRGAICIQSLTPKQINQYLDRGGEQLKAVKTLLQADTALQELAKSPLMLSIMTLAYQGVSVEELPQTGSLEKHRQHLFNTYIERIFRRKGAEQQYSKAQVIHWLIWLAKLMSQASQTIFLIERMQPSWLQTRTQKRLYRFGSLLIGALIGGLISALIGWLGGSQVNLVTPSLLIGIPIAGLSLLWQMIEIKTVETLRWSWQEARKFLINGIVVALPLGLIVGLLMNMYGIKWPNWLILGLIYWLIGGVILGVLGGLRGPEIERKIISNQGIWKSAQNAVILGLIGALIGGLIGLSSGSINNIDKNHTWHILGLDFGLIFGLIFGGGKACIQHFILRLILWRNRYIPWNYASLLDYATKLIFLQKVGGGYILIHRMMLEHFAQMD